jgi:chemotaxis protein MotB
MGSKERNNGEGESGDTSAWMVTFSDLIMLLLTFFVLLLTMSSLDQKALKELISHLKDSTGVLEFSGFGEVSNLTTLIEKYNTSESKIVISHKKLVELCGPNIKVPESMKDTAEDLEALIEIKDDERGISLSFHENIFFKSGTTEIEKGSYGILESVADAIAGCRNDMLIMGHTDSTPVKRGKYPSNWELSAYRGLALLDYFLKEKKQEPKRFAVGGYGFSRPLNPNDTQQNKSTNRRVEIIFKPLEES